MIDQARREAVILDEEFTTTGTVRGPLHGVPVSLKDLCECVYCFTLSTTLTESHIDKVKGVDATIGFSE